MPYQPFWNALICGGITALATATATYTLPGAAFNPTEKGYIAGTAGASSFIVSLGLESYLSNRMRRQVKDMRSQMDSLCQGNFPVRATVYSLDELGHLATRFNQMAVVVETMMDDFDRQVQTWEYGNENISRQVLALEEAIKSWATGDFSVTTRAKLPEELGVVAYSLNLIAISLQERMRQVKTSAQKVAQEVTNSEKSAKFFGQVHQDRARLKHPDRCGPAVVHQRRNFGVGVDRHETAAKLIAFANADHPCVVFGTTIASRQQLFEHHRDLHAIGRGH